MLLAVELILLLAAAVAVLFLGRDVWLRRRGAETESAYVERLAGDEEPDYESDSEAEEPLTGDRRPLERRVDSAGLPFGPVGYLLVLALVAIVVAAVALWFLPQLPWIGLLIGLLAAYLAHLLIGEWGRYRARRFERDLVQAIDFMISALLAGENATQSMISAASASRGAVKKELIEIPRRLDAGFSIREALRPMVRSYDTEAVRLFAQTMAVKWQIGGDLAPVLETLVWIMRERIRLHLRLRTELTGVQIAAIMVALLPYLLLPVFIAQRPQWTQILMTHPLGPPLLGGAIALQLVGLLWLRRILRIEL